jgi:polysaccharide deacetylase family sporulation protein PdaB
MFETNIRLISILGLLTIVVIISLVLDYRRMLRRPTRLGLGLAILGIIAGCFFTLTAVLPDNGFYGPVYTEVKTTQKIVALTFDDGPNPPYTGEILDILKEYKVPATFFIIGKNAEKHPELVRRIFAEGHEIGNHTYNHIDLLKANQQTIIEEIDRTNNVIRTITGQAPRVVRPPHGFRDSVVMEVMAERKLKVVEWSVASRDWTNPGADVIASRTLGKVKSGSVILLHDGDGVEARASRAQTVEATRVIIRELLAQGYRFVTVNEILAKTGD